MTTLIFVSACRMMLMYVAVCCHTLVVVVNAYKAVCWYVVLKTAY